VPTNSKQHSTAAAIAAAADAVNTRGRGRRCAKAGTQQRRRAGHTLSNRPPAMYRTEQRAASSKI